MKKLVALAVALALVLCAATALAAVTQIPLTIEEVPNMPEQPVMPGHVLSVVDDHYELKVNMAELPENSASYCYWQLSGFNSEKNTFQWVQLRWNEEKKTFVSEELLSSEYNEESIVFTYDNPDNSNNYQSVYYSIAEDKVTSAIVLGNNSSYAWYENRFCWGEQYTEGYINVYFDRATEKVESYTVSENGLQIEYDPYGRITWVTQDVDDQWCYWNEDKQAWMNGNEEVNADPFVAADHPAPVAIPYVIETIPATLSDAKKADGEIKEYEDYTWYSGENIGVYYKNTTGEINEYYVYGWDYTASYDKYGRLTYAQKKIDGTYYYWDQYKQEWYRWDDGERVVAENAAPFDVAAPYAIPYEVKLLADTYAGVNTGVKAEDMKIPLGAVENSGSLLTIADMDYDYVQVWVVFEDYDESYELNCNDGKWEIDLDRFDGGIIEGIYLGKNDIRAMYSTDGTFHSSEMWNDAYDIYYYDDGTIEVFSNLHNSGAFYDAAGNMISYSYSNLAGTKNVTYAIDGTLLEASINSVNGNYYIYNAKKGGWFVEQYDEETDEWTVIPVDPSELPEDVNTDDMQPIIIAAAKPQYTWYPNNTVGVVGLSLRDNYPSLTSKWYNVVPVDLTQDGVQTFRLVASNLFYIGQAAVIVDGDNITVEYALADGHGYVKDECVQWFTSVEEITSDFLNDPHSDLAFGQTISRESDLNGQDVALLFICNHVTYRQPYTNSGVSLTRYWPNLDEWKAYREDLNVLMEQLAQ